MRRLLEHNSLALRYANCQAINNLSAVNEYKQKIVDAGVLPYYFDLLGPERDERVHAAASYGLWLLGSQYITNGDKHYII